MSHIQQNASFPEQDEVEVDDFIELSDIHTALPSYFASEIDPNFFKSTSKETFRSALQRASAIYRTDFLKYRPLGSTGFSSPSLDSPPSTSRDSFTVKRVLFPGELRLSAIKHKVLHTAVQSVVELKVSKGVDRYIPWNATLEQTRSYFGRATSSYFRLIRFLFILNCFLSLFVFLFLILPFLFLSSSPNTPVVNAADCSERLGQLEPLLCNITRLSNFLECSHDYRQSIADSLNNATWVSHLTNIVRGQGYLTLTPLYYAYYTDILYSGDEAYPGGVIYLAVIAAAFLITFVTLLVLSYKSVLENSLHRSDDFRYRFASAAFSGWDHKSSGKLSCDSRQATVRRYLKSEIERVLRKIAAEKLSGWTFVRIWIVRCIFMVVSLAIIAGSVLIILISSSCAQIQLEKAESGEGAGSDFETLAADFLPPIVIVVLNTFQPDIFVALAKFENYAPETEVKLILFRLILSRFATVVTFMVPLLGFQLKDACPMKSSSTSSNNATNVSFTCAVIKLEQTITQKSYCWEANIGEQLYKLIITDIISTVIFTFAYSYVRRILVDKLGHRPSCGIWKKIGRREFELPVEIINLFYIQTICWMGLYFMPLLPVFAAATRFALFYLKRWDLFDNTYLTWRVRAAEFVDGFYAAYLCGCFFVALTFTGYASTVMTSSPGCGPFAMSNNVSALYAVFEEVNAMSSTAGVAAETLSHPLVAGSCVTIICFIAICGHLFALSTKRRVNAIRQLIAAEQHVRDYYFSQIATTNARNLPNRFNASPSPGPVNTRLHRRVLNNDVPSTYGPEFVYGSGIYEMRRQMSRF